MRRDAIVIAIAGDRYVPKDVIIRIHVGKRDAVAAGNTRVPLTEREPKAIGVVEAKAQRGVRGVRQNPKSKPSLSA